MLAQSASQGALAKEVVTGLWGCGLALMVDQAVEFEVVTADGATRTINECTDPDLFWAIRGDGGGNYAVLISYQFQLHSAVPINVYNIQVKFPKPNGENGHDPVEGSPRHSYSFGTELEYFFQARYRGLQLHPQRQDHITSGDAIRR
jgi:hypothetical protein